MGAASWSTIRRARNRLGQIAPNERQTSRGIIWREPVLTHAVSVFDVGGSGKYVRPNVAPLALPKSPPLVY